MEIKVYVKTKTKNPLFSPQSFHLKKFKTRGKKKLLKGESIKQEINERKKIIEKDEINFIKSYLTI